MAKIKKYWSVVGYVVILAVVVALREFAPTPVQASGSAPVIVTNTPLPVSAAQSGPWNVGITGTPTFSLAPGASVRDADNPARQPVQFSTGCIIGSTFFDCGSLSVYAVPSGKRLVIEYAAAWVGLPTTQKLSRLIINTELGGSTGANFLAPSYQADDGTTAFFGASEATRLYADPGTSVGWDCVVNNNSGGGSCEITFSGYLVNVP